jgi:hypothetical protein
MSEPGASRPERSALALDPARLVELLIGDGTIAAGEARDFARLAAALRAHFHHELLAVKERVRRAWDRLEGRDGHAVAASEDQRELAKDLLRTLRRLLQRANFVPVRVDELDEAMRRSTASGLSIDLDLSDFEELAAWRRAEVRVPHVEKRWFGLRERRTTLLRLDRFCLFARFKGAERFADRTALEGKLGARPGGVTLRLYRDVPKHDVESLFPGVRIRMRLFDRALLGVPAAAGALQVINLKLMSSLYAVGLTVLVFLGLRQDEPEVTARALTECAGVAVLATFLFRQWARFLGRKNLLHRQLAEQLQTCTLDTGAGVLLHLLDEAEMQETAEALLAYALLRGAAGGGAGGASVAVLDTAALDAKVERWLAERLGIKVDFEEEDAVAKLLRLGLACRAPDGGLTAIAPDAALATLEERWRRLFHGG